VSPIARYFARRNLSQPAIFGCEHEDSMAVYHAGRSTSAFGSAWIIAAASRRVTSGFARIALAD
jgi:hypothetical protein